MKTRLDFITNSSSSSFIILKKNITKKQLLLIINHGDLKRVGNDAWKIVCDDDIVKGSTIMDNFNMREYLESIGICGSKIFWNYD